jgi:hypothetical protein
MNATGDICSLGLGICLSNVTGVGTSFNLSSNSLMNITNDGTKTTFLGTAGDYNRIGD